MTTVGRGATLLFSLPVPALAAGSTVPFYIIDPRDAADRTLNECCSSWWRTRLALTNALLTVQERTLTVATTEEDAFPAASELASELGVALQLATHNAQQWANLYRELYKRGSAWRARCTFVPRWTVLGPVLCFLVYDFGRLSVDVACCEKTHESASLAFEGVMMGYLQAALQQQLATMLNLLLRQGLATTAVTDAQVVELLQRARATLKDVVENKLTLHSALLDGTESFLLSAHFYQHFLLRIIYAQQHMVEAACMYIRSTRTETADVAGLLCSAGLFALSSRVLGAAQRAGYCDIHLLGGLAFSRQSSALITLALALHTADKQMTPCGVLTYTHALRVTDSVPDYRAMAIEAYYCARASVALTPDIEAGRRIFERVSLRLKSMYGAILPADPPLLPPHVAYEIRRSGGTRVVNLRRDFGRITIETQLSNATTSLEMLHPQPTSEVLSVGMERRTFVIKAACDVK